MYEKLEKMPEIEKTQMDPELKMKWYKEWYKKWWAWWCILSVVSMIVRMIIGG